MRKIVEKIANHKSKIAVFGDVMLDHYLEGDADRISPEAPVQVIEIQNERYILGGAGNVVNNLVVFGADVSLFSVIGDDKNGDRILKMFKDIGVDTSGVIKDENRQTSIKSRILSRHQQIIRFDRENRDEISQDIEIQILERFQKYIENFNVILISDYGKGFISNSLSQKIVEIAKKRGVKVLIDPKGEDYSKYRGAYLIKPNRKEAFEAIKGEKSIDRVGVELIHRFNFEKVVITLSENGVKLFHKNGTVDSFPTKARDVFDVTGAGDTVLSALAVGVSSGISLEEAIQFANLSAAIVIGKVGTSTVSLDEVVEYDKERFHNLGEGKIKDWKTLKSILDKERDRKIVFTNGCFDILHIGHVKYLEVAKSFGDILVVGLNSDASVRRLKGDSRPINSEDDRAYILAGLQSVDYVVKFEEDTPYQLIDYLKPNILVKGGDYRGKEVVGSELVDEVRLVDFVDGKSTTKIVEKIREKR